MPQNTKTQKHKNTKTPSYAKASDGKQKHLSAETLAKEDENTRLRLKTRKHLR
ncbi:hypothetical protein KKC83_02470 [Patescibacteria group bacterium]|nr:hypothetical protein [Patescibacteria group bacterium]MBU4015056.1 hypothetical protein [Patescibacteria group bacterium]MBU4026381.1 hypothetical protein [Patescibacteria group bacterium]MBU4072646.1 hypothetical protein [Patescibacteria group bacterium]MBU4102779.1 hypothetical protein [Patescibacteria group bacterium]